MAIQQINLGSAPSGAGGDTQRAANAKINQNFSNQTHAASRLVGTANGNVVEMGSQGVAATGWGSTQGASLQGAEDRKALNTSGVYRVENTSVGIGAAYSPLLFVSTTDTFFAMSVAYGTGKAEICYGTKNSVLRGDVVPENNKMTLYTTKNTTVEENTNYLKVSSPILRLQHDSFEKEHEAEAMDIKVENPETGVYKVTGTTGLRSDGWYFSPPKDEHNNVLCMVEVEEDGDIVTVKTYKKKFDFETVSIVPDYDNPTDIPDGAIVMLRFNDLPEEQLDEPIE